MRVTGIINRIKPSNYGIGLRQVKSATQKAKTSVKNLEKRGGFMSTPIKYYAIGLLLPVPFASALGLIIGLGVATYKKVLRKDKENFDSSS